MEALGVHSESCELARSYRCEEIATEEVSHDESIWTMAVLRRQLGRKVKAREKSKQRQFNNATLKKVIYPR